jgi:hypothetical protein
MRVHMLALGLPLEGDLFYPEALRGPGAPDDFSQPLQLLAQRIAFFDPVIGTGRVPKASAACASRPIKGQVSSGGAPDSCDRTRSHEIRSLDVGTVRHI